MNHPTTELSPERRLAPRKRSEGLSIISTLVGILIVSVVIWLLILLRC